MPKTLAQINQMFGYITQEEAEPGNPDTGVYFQVLKMEVPTDPETGQPRLDPETGEPVPAEPVDYDDQATSDEYNAWKLENGYGRAAGEEPAE